MIAAINYWSFEHGLANSHPISLAAQEAAACEFQAIELAIAETGCLNVQSSQAECKEIRAIVEACGLELQSIASGMSWGTPPTHPDPRVRKRSIELHELALQRASWLGCTSMLFVPGAVSIPWDDTFPFVPYEQALCWARSATESLARAAERYQVKLCIENVWNGMFYSPLEFRDFIDSISSPMVAAYFDAGNCMGQHQYPPHWIEILGCRIERVHVKDFKRSIGTLNGFCDLLEGDQPWAETMAALRTVGYDKTLTAEMIPYAKGRVEKTGRALNRIIRM